MQVDGNQVLLVVCSTPYIFIHKYTDCFGTKVYRWPLCPCKPLCNSITVDPYKWICCDKLFVVGVSLWIVNPSYAVPKRHFVKIAWVHFHISNAISSALVIQRITVYGGNVAMQWWYLRGYIMDSWNLYYQKSILKSILTSLKHIFNGLWPSGSCF